MEKAQNSGPLETFLSGLLNISPSDQPNQKTEHMRSDQPEHLHSNSQGYVDTGAQVSCSLVNWKGGGIFF